MEIIQDPSHVRVLVVRPGNALQPGCHGLSPSRVAGGPGIELERQAQSESTMALSRSLPVSALLLWTNGADGPVGMSESDRP
jgi:hypothetical protein